MKRFIFDTIVDAENICDLATERQTIQKVIDSSGKLVIYGRRNTGKTSLIKSVLIPYFLKKHKGGFVFFCDLLGVGTMTQLNSRIRSAFERAYAQAFPSKSMFTNMLDSIKRLRPTANIDPTSGALELSIKAAVDGKPVTFTQIFAELRALHKKVPLMIVLDEFQDIHNVAEAEALMRDALQNLPFSIPILLSGSKKHILSNIFSSNQSPFFNWGSDLSIKPISFSTYREYLNERFATTNLYIDEEESIFLQELLGRIPEPINMVASRLYDELGSKAIKQKKMMSITKTDIQEALLVTIESRSGRFEEYLSLLTANEEQVLLHMAIEQPVKAPTSKEFLAKTGLSARGMSKIVQKMLGEANIYRENYGYELADPLLAEYLRKFR